ncbi:hypothetical protein DFH08DRAFT_1033914 [Mycena albidolilacea]|uniref:Uncharacterized protein n=1 Tax=Mycena albidolilacea TaxID=1033008 RepID=A0AAD7EHD0_9AGAR|nr:hypothetical protein DFH08DRAFT_1033914 [Mycena albidolilacea]
MGQMEAEKDVREASMLQIPAGKIKAGYTDLSCGPEEVTRGENSTDARIFEISESKPREESEYSTISGKIFINFLCVPMGRPEFESAKDLSPSAEKAVALSRRQGRLGSSWPRCGKRKDAALCACETRWGAALCACGADVEKVVCVCGGFGRPGRAGLSRDSGRAAGKAGSEEDVARDGTEPVRKGGHGSRRTRPGATQQERRQPRATGSCEGERNGPRPHATASEKKWGKDNTITM